MISWFLKQVYIVLNSVIFNSSLKKVRRILLVLSFFSHLPFTSSLSLPVIFSKSHHFLYCFVSKGKFPTFGCWDLGPSRMCKWDLKNINIFNILFILLGISIQRTTLLHLASPLFTSISCCCPLECDGSPLLPPSTHLGTHYYGSQDLLHYLKCNREFITQFNEYNYLMEF